MRREGPRDLRAVQGALFALITGHGAPGGTPDVETLIVGNARAGARERLQVYAHMYQARLVEALEAQFPRLARRLGGEAFAAVVSAYAADHPSHHPSLRFLGRDLPGWLARAGVAQGLADLACLEWVRADVFDERDEPLLTLDAVRARPTEALAALPLRAVAASRLIEVDAGALALWDEPEAGAAPRGRTAVLVWRKDVAVYHRPVDEAERAALGRAAEGTSFGALCETLAATLPAEEAIGRAFAWLSTWLADEMLVAA
jgi:hypothetical protein